jgi:hypothetical protein
MAAVRARRGFRGQLVASPAMRREHATVTTHDDLAFSRAGGAPLIGGHRSTGWPAGAA